MLYYPVKSVTWKCLALVGLILSVLSSGKGLPSETNALTSIKHSTILIKSTVQRNPRLYFNLPESGAIQAINAQCDSMFIAVNQKPINTIHIISECKKLVKAIQYAREMEYRQEIPEIAPRTIQYNYFSIGD